MNRFLAATTLTLLTGTIAGAQDVQSSTSAVTPPAISSSTTSGASGMSPAAVVPVTNIQNPGTPAAAAALKQPQAVQTRQALLSGQSAPQPNKWVQLDKNAKNFSQQEAQFHLNRAREAYMLKNYSQAADEIQRANAQLELQAAALADARTQLQQLASKARSGQLNGGDDISTLYNQAMNYQSRVQNEVPIGPTLASAFRDEPRYHFDQARALFARKSYNDASQQIQTGVQYLKLEQEESSGQRKVALQDSINRLTDIAKNVKSGSTDSMAQLDQAIEGAERALNQPS